MIETVLGPVQTDQLGYTLMHEHLMICDWNLRTADPEFLDYEKTGWLVFLENLLILSFWAFIGTQAALICLKTKKE